MKLAPNAVYALKHNFDGNVYAFLHVNKNDLINPFWLYDNGRSFSAYGEFCKWEKAGGHEHWRDFGIETEVTMIQSHVTKASDVDFKRCRKMARKVAKRKPQ